MSKRFLRFGSGLPICVVIGAAGLVGCGTASDVAASTAALICDSGVSPQYSVADEYDGSSLQPLVAGTVSMPPNGGYVSAPNGILANDVGIDCTPYIVIDSPPLHGSLAMEADGDFVYTPDARLGVFTCGDRFHYHLFHMAGTGNEVQAHIDFPSSHCHSFYWQAYNPEPYIYKGCPEPGPEPWADEPTFRADTADQVVDVILATDVELNVAVVTQPANGRVLTNANGFAFDATIPGASTGRAELRITHGRCVYDVAANFEVVR